MTWTPATARPSITRTNTRTARPGVPRRVARTGLATASVAVLAAATACSGGQADDGAVRIGLVASLSGVYQSIGTDMRDGFQLYLDTHGGKLGGHKVTLVVADEGDGAATATPAVTKLIKRDRVVAVAGIVGGGSAAAAASLLTENQIPLVNTGGRPNLKNADWVWTTSFKSDEPGAAIAGYVKDHAGGPVYAIGPDYQGGHDELRGFTDAFTRAGGQLANPGGQTTWTPFPATTNFLPYFARVADSGAKAVYCFYAGKAAVDFVTQYRRSDIADLPLYSPGFLTEGDDVLAAQADAARGIWTVLNYAPDLDNAANREFVAAWRAEHESTPTTYAMSAWDAAAVLDAAIGALGDKPVTAEAINTALGRLGQITSPRGEWTFNPTSHTPVQTWYLRQVRPDGKALANVLVEDLATLGA